MADDLLSRRALGRALLARQHLLERAPADADGPTGVVALTDRLVGLQAQNPVSPYVALWDRLDGFVPEHLSCALLDRRAVRVAAMRSTVHLLTAQDGLILPVLTARRLSREARAIPASELGRLALRARSLVEAEPQRPSRLGALLAPDFPGVLPSDLAYAARCQLSLVQVTPRGVWRQPFATTWTTAEAWLPPELVAQAPDLSDADVRAEVLGRLVLRYLAAFGPASVADVQAWCGLTGLAAVVRALGDRVVHLQPPADTGGRPGRPLLDLPDAPRPDPDVPAPVRLLADFDNALLSHADRSRVISDDVRGRLVTPNGAGPGTVLVDGQVAGVWRLRRTRDGTGGGPARGDRDVATLTVEPFVDLAAADRAQVLQEAERLVRFLAQDADEQRAVLAEES